MNLRLLPAFALTLGFTLACSGGSSTVEAPPPPPPPTDGSIGVQECDAYIKKVEDCLGNLPVEAKASVETSLKANRDAWAQAAATPQGKTALASGCKMAVDAFTCPDMGATGATGAPADGTGAPPADGATAGGTAAGTPPADGTATTTTTTTTAASSDGTTETSTTTTRTRQTATPGSGAYDPKPKSMEHSRSGSGKRDGASGTGKRDGGGGADLDHRR